ncbi:hypothetical protein LTR85_003623 [Meristemomyces frigidus]|nr:hypothetical protein LTR85_003623 [Meristemomyces frigidus]
MASPSQSPLLKLPRELRNKIYEFIILDQPIGLKDNALLQHSVQPSTSLFTSNATIILASKQLHVEYFEMHHTVTMSPKFPDAVIAVTVKDMDFSGLTAFIEGLIPHNRTVIGAKLHVRIYVSSTNPAESDKSAKTLAEYLILCDSADIVARYEVQINNAMPSLIRLRVRGRGKEDL